MHSRRFGSHLWEKAHAEEVIQIILDQKVEKRNCLIGNESVEKLEHYETKMNSMVFSEET